MKLFATIAVILALGCTTTASQTSVTASPPPATAVQPEEKPYTWESPIDPMEFLEWDVQMATPLGMVPGLGNLIDIYSVNPDENAEYKYVNFTAITTGIVSFGLVSPNGCLSVYKFEATETVPNYAFCPCSEDYRETYDMFKSSMEQVFGITIFIPQGV